MHRTDPRIQAARDHFRAEWRDRERDTAVLWPALTFLTEEVERMSAELDAIQQALAAQDTLIGQAITLLDGIPAATAGAVAAAQAGDKAEADSILAGIEAHSTALSAALTAAGPQAPAGTTTPTPATTVPASVAPATPVAPPAPAPGA